MILLDTNVVSEPLRRAPDARVVEWIDAQLVDTLWLSAITAAELRAGIALLPAGRRRDALASDMETKVLPLFEGRILPFDEARAGPCAALTARARSAGLAIAAADGFIAAIALMHGLAVATRDTAPFEAAGVATIDPWQS